MKKLLIVFFCVNFTLLFSQIENFEICKHAQTQYKNSFFKKPAIVEQSWFDAKYYKLDLDFKTSNYEITGEVTCKLEILKDNTNEIVLDFADKTNSGQNWLDFSVSGQVASYIFSGNLLRITLDKNYNINDLVTVIINYRGYPQNSGLTFVKDNVTKRLVISSLSEPFLARTWWPCKDIPKDKADSVDINITVPDSLIAASNGTLVNTINNGNGTTTYQWQERYPITTYLVSVAIANYSFFEQIWNYEGYNMPLYYYCLPEDVESANYFFSVMPNILTQFSNYFGTYPFIEEKYGHAYFTHGGAMEHQTLSSFYRGYLTSDRVYAHELGHQWFGDLTTCENWSEIWMNEGFASYTEAIWEESQGGIDAYFNKIHGYVPSVNNFAAGKIFVTDTNIVGSIFSSTVYRKGMWVLHMLRYVLGDADFFQILNNYTSETEFYHKTTTTQKFKTYCEQISGKNLQTFFDQWIYKYGYPMYEWNWKMVTSDSLMLIVKQNQKDGFFNNPSTYYEMPIQFALRYVDGIRDTISILNNAQEIQDVTIYIKKEVNAVGIDPNGWILCNTNFNANLTPDSINGENFVIQDFKILESYPNPFPNPTNPSLAINFSMPSNGLVSMEIYNILGQLIYSKQEYFGKNGSQKIFWNGIEKNNRDASSGIYLVRLSHKNYSSTTKVLKIK